MKVAGRGAAIEEFVGGDYTVKENHLRTCGSNDQALWISVVTGKSSGEPENAQEECTGRPRQRPDIEEFCARRGRHYDRSSGGDPVRCR